MAEVYGNGGNSTLAAGISSTATSLTVVSATGFSTSPTFRLQITSATAGNNNVELLEVTGVSGSTFTVTRAAEAYNGVQTAYAWNAGDFVTQVLTAAAMPTGGATIPSYDTTVLTKLSLAPVAYWKLNDPVGSTTAADSSGNGYDLTVNGTVTFGGASVVPSDSETSVQGDGSTGYLSGGPFAKVPTGANPCTVIAAAQAPNSGSTTAETIAMIGLDTSVGTDMRFFYNFTNAQYSQATNTENQYAGLTDGNPHLIGCSYSAGGSNLWFDGTLVSTSLLTPNLSSATVNILALNGGGFYGTAPTGRVAIFAGVLTPKDWALLMQAFTGV